MLLRLTAVLISLAVCFSNNSFCQTNTFPSNGNTGIGTISPAALLEVNPPLAVQTIFAARQQGVAGFFVKSISTSGQPYMQFEFHNGNVGIGTQTPNYPLDINGNVHAFNARLLVEHGNTGWSMFRVIPVENFVSVDAIDNSQVTPKNLIFQINGGNVAIGTQDPQGYKLAVNGSAIFTKVVVKTYGLWPDYVFHSTYPLRSLDSLESFINSYHHLPELPSAKDVEKNGLDIASTQAALLKKIEELSLYLIKQNKEKETLQNELSELSKKVARLEKLNRKKQI